MPDQPTIRVVVDTDRMAQVVGHHWNSAYVEWFWLPVVGPSSLWILRRLLASGHGSIFTVVQLAEALAIAPKVAERGVDRLVRFGLGRWTRNGAELVLSEYLPPISSNQLARLPDWMQAAHDAEYGRAAA